MLAELRGLKVLPPHGAWVTEATAARTDLYKDIEVSDLRG